MWVMTTKGFYSTTATPEGDAMVRCRDESDAARFAAAVGGEVLSTPRADYPFRVIVPMERWARFVSDEASAIDYRNFKAEVTRLQGRQRHDVYMRVWSDLHGLERRPEQMLLPLWAPDDESDAAWTCECGHEVLEHGDEAWVDHLDEGRHSPDECLASCPGDACQAEGCECDRFTETEVATV